MSLRFAATCRFVVFALMLVAFGEWASGQDTLPGLKQGAHAPAFKLKDQTGHTQSLDSLKGKNGLLLLFFRSADWCPFCKQQVLQLAAAQGEFEAKGIRVAGISYDSVDILATFEKRHQLNLTLLSDEKSATIRNFGILNPTATDFEVGIPYPGMYLIAPDGTIKARFFEQDYANRYTPNLVYANLFQGEPLPAAHERSIDAPHLKVVLTQSDTKALVGDRVRLVVSLKLPEDVHAYAPGAETHGYKVVKLTLAANPLYTALPASYPEGKPMRFEVLNETVPVYTGQVAIAQDIYLAGKSIFRQVQSGQTTDATIAGTLDVQACNASTCFSPQSIPVVWKVAFEKADLERSPEGIQHK